MRERERITKRKKDTRNNNNNNNNTKKRGDIETDNRLTLYRD